MVYFLSVIAHGPSRFIYQKTDKIEFGDKLDKYEYYGCTVFMGRNIPSRPQR